MRQWPAEHFAALIDLLVEEERVNAVLIGGPEEAELAEEVLDKIVRRDCRGFAGRQDADCRAARAVGCMRALCRQQLRTRSISPPRLACRRLASTRA